MMKWKKLGKIFDPTEHSLPHNCFAFAQSPQALVMDDRVRVFFSTREKDNTGKFLSHIAFVDYDKSMQKILNISTHTVIELGGLGCFDEHGIFPINVVRDGDRILAFTTGWNRKVSVPVDAAIGLAISEDDGFTFSKYGKGPIVASALNEPFLVGDAFVARYDGLYHMWYIFGSKWEIFDGGEQPDRVYKIAHATSQDGVEWSRDGRSIIPDRLNEDECQALPTVFYWGGGYHMYFCYRQAYGFRTQRDNAYRLGYAFSNDLVNWTRDDSLSGIDVSECGWDSQMQCYPHVFVVEDKAYLLYNGNEFGRTGFGLAVLTES